MGSSQSNEQALFFEALTHDHAILHALKKKGVSHPDAQDILHDTYAKFLAMTEQQRSEIQALRAFLIRVATNRANDVLKRPDLIVYLASTDETVLNAQDARPLPETDAIARQHLTRIYGVIARLPAHLRRIFVRHRVNGDSIAKIAAAENLSADNTRKRLGKADQRVRSSAAAKEIGMAGPPAKKSRAGRGKGRSDS